MEILLAVLVIAVVAYVAFWLIDQSFPGPANMIAKLIVGITVLFAVVKYLGVSF